MKITWRAAAVLAGALWMCGCSVTLGAVNPRPNVALPAATGGYSLDLGRAVLDRQELDRVSILEFYRTLLAGFRNATGSRFQPGGPGHRLIIDLATVDLGENALARFLRLQFHAHWIGPDGKLVTEVAGVAEPRDPTQTGARHLEDVVEVMYEKIFEALPRN